MIISKMINILIADDNILFGSLLNDCLDRYEDMKTLGIAKDGIQAIDMIEELSPDVVILDIAMPNLDGIGVLERIPAMQLKKDPLFIALSANGRDVLIQQVILLGAEYYIIKPFEVDVLVTRIRQICRKKYISPILSGGSGNTINMQCTKGSMKNIEKQVTELILGAGIPPHLPGYRYLREAIVQTVLGGGRAQSSLTKVLYPTIAGKFNTTPCRVERGIRSAIESAWSRSDNRTRTMMTGIRIPNGRVKPMNSELIAIISEKIRLSR